MRTQNSFNQAHPKTKSRQRNTLSRLAGLVCLVVSVGASTQVQTPVQEPVNKKEQQRQQNAAEQPAVVKEPVPAVVKTSEERVFDLVTEQAKSLAEKPYAQPKQNLPAELADMNYQQYRAIRFNPQQAQWKDKAKFEMQLFHPGFLYRTPVEIKV
ncbi:MAG: glucan biosynthesis protein, partial [Paraglaciecola polaris]